MLSLFLSSDTINDPYKKLNRLALKKNDNIIHFYGQLTLDKKNYYANMDFTIKDLMVPKTDFPILPQMEESDTVIFILRKVLL